MKKNLGISFSSVSDGRRLAANRRNRRGIVREVVRPVTAKPTRLAFVVFRLKLY